MIESLIGMLVLGGTGAGLYATYVKTRSFVRERLRFVDAAQRLSLAMLTYQMKLIAGRSWVGSLTTKKVDIESSRLLGFIILFHCNIKWT